MKPLPAGTCDKSRQHPLAVQSQRHPFTESALHVHPFKNRDNACTRRYSWYVPTILQTVLHAVKPALICEGTLKALLRPRLSCFLALVHPGHGNSQVRQDGQEASASEWPHQPVPLLRSPAHSKCLRGASCAGKGRECGQVYYQNSSRQTAAVTAC
jgi:hypothetical protein